MAGIEHDRLTSADAKSDDRAFDRAIRPLGRLLGSELANQDQRKTEDSHQKQQDIEEGFANDPAEGISKLRTK